MKKAGIVVGVILAVLALSIFVAWPELKKSFKEGYDKAFIPGFKKSFLRQCLQDDPAQQKRIFCECAVEEVVTQLSIDELHNQEYAKQYISSKILPVCMERSKAAAELLAKEAVNPQENS